MAEPPLQRSTLLDLGDDGRVVTDTSVETEVSAVYLAEADRAEIGCVDAVGEQFDRLDRIVRHPQSAGKHICRSSWKYSEGRVGASDPSSDFVEGAIAAKADNNVEPAPCGIVGKSCGMPAAVRFDHFDVVALSQATVNDHSVARRYR